MSCPEHRLWIRFLAQEQASEKEKEGERAFDAGLMAFPLALAPQQVLS